MTIELLSGEFTVCQVASLADAPLEDEFCFFAKTDAERSLVCETKSAPAACVRREDGWRAMRILGPLPFSMIGVLARVADALAEAKVSLFAVSTYDTDYVLVKGENLPEALRALAQAGFEGLF